MAPRSESCSIDPPPETTGARELFEIASLPAALNVPLADALGLGVCARYARMTLRL